MEDEFFNFYDNRGISSLDERAWKAPRTADDGRTSSFSSAVHQEVVSRKSISKSRKSNTSENSKQGKVKRNAAEADRFIGTKERLEIRSDCRDGKARIDDEALKWLHQLSDDVTLQSNAESSPNHLRNPESNASPWNGRGESNCFQEDIGKSQLSLLHASNNVLSSSTRHFVQNGQEFAENPEIREETALLNCSRAELESIEKCTALVSRNAKEVYAVEETQPVEIPVAEYDEFRIPGPAGELIHHQDYGFDETVQILNLRNSGEDNKKEFHSGPWVSAMDVLDAKMVKGEDLFFFWWTMNWFKRFYCFNLGSWSVGWTTFDYLISEGRGGRVEQVIYRNIV